MTEKASYFNGVSSHQEMLDKLVGSHKLKEIVGRATIKEGYGA
ncbi:MAG: hypothetical protein Q7R32_08725 [Dehalococcoidia bacterium]|nr:hypothetical protein [Dehalococcoidia bacterium]